MSIEDGMSFPILFLVFSILIVTRHNSQFVLWFCLFHRLCFYVLIKKTFCSCVCMWLFLCLLYELCVSVVCVRVVQLSVHNKEHCYLYWAAQKSCGGKEWDTLQKNIIKFYKGLSYWGQLIPTDLDKKCQFIDQYP